MWVGGQRHAPAALPPGKTRHPLYTRLGRPQGRPRQVREISPPPGFDRRTVQPVPQSLYRLSYRAPFVNCTQVLFPSSKALCLIKYRTMAVCLCTPLHTYERQHPCVTFHSPYSHACILVHCLYTPASVSTTLIHFEALYYAVCTSLHQFALSFTWPYFSALFVQPCISFCCYYSRRRILFRCLYITESVSTVLIHISVF
jgi:hypothetical protein